ncbi:helix-turn-helix transcriptional regulator [Paenibacillus silvae]|uniref:helix-turn-helix transcriptional regulator n=1 Tax=Paenibacillus silvae TaxID=1325358 RepID=UPI003CEBA037
MRLWLKEFRETANKTQVVVADEAEISRSYYTNIENGTKTPSVNTAKSIARVLCFQWELFFDDKCSFKEQNVEVNTDKEVV